MSKRIPIFFGIILTFLALWLLISPSRFTQNFLERLDHIGYDLQLRTRLLTEVKKPETPIVIVDIDDKSLAIEGRWPWQRSKVAQLVNQLQLQGAAVIAFDMFFAEKEPNVGESVLQHFRRHNMLNEELNALLQKNLNLFDEDTIFAESLSKTQAVLALGFLPRSQQQNILPPPALKLSAEDQDTLGLIKLPGYISNIPILQNAAKGAGFINIFPDNDGIIREVPLVIQYKEGVYVGLALQAVMTFLGEGISLITPVYHKTKRLEGIQLGETVIPTDASGEVLIPFIGRSYTFPYYSATDVIHGKIAKDTFLGKIVFIGTSATGSGDLKPTAMQNPFPGVEIQASISNGILLNNFSYKPAWTFGANVVLTFLFGLIAAFLFPYLGPRTLSLVIILLPPAILFLNNWFWTQTGLILSVLIPVFLVLAIALLNMIYGYLFETRRREHLKEMFGQYVPEKHIDEMLKTRGSYALRGEDREMSVLFADIRNFATISEGLSATQLVELLNTLFTPMTEVIFKHRGTIDKYIGDLIMAFWGAPLRDRNHARHALQSALEMQTKLKELRETMASHQWPDIRMGIGINSGVMSVGDMGSRYRRNYTVLGDEVNLASRIEGLTKYYGVNIVVTEHTQKNQTRFVFRKLDRVCVKGKTLPVEIYELLCTQLQLTPDLKEELEHYHLAQEYYFQQRWDEALSAFTKLNKQFPEKKIYQIYIERIEEFKIHPRPTDWDGCYVHVEK